MNAVTNIYTSTDADTLVQMLGVYSPHYEPDTVQVRFLVAQNEKKIHQTILKITLPLQKPIPKRAKG